MRVALIHYWLTTMRGGEKILEALCKLYPQADIFTHVYTPEAMSPQIRKHTVRTSFINQLPFAQHLYQHYLPLMPLALEQLDLRGYDLVISSESGPAKGVLTDQGATHLCYCHTPMRYIWDFYQQYLEQMGFCTRLAMRVLSHRLRQWDVLSANRVDYFAANSYNVAGRIRKHYRRESQVIYPPVDVAAFAPPQGQCPTSGEYYLYLGQLVHYKRVDIAVEACTRLGRRLLIVGEGEATKKLQKLAGHTVEFLGRQSQEAIRQLVQGCRALLFPGEEDFGIVPLEAMAAGRPVLAYAKGGALETVVHGSTGLYFYEQSTTSLMQTIKDFEDKEHTFSPQTLTNHALAFSPERFAKEFADFATKACSHNAEHLLQGR